MSAKSKKFKIYGIVFLTIILVFFFMPKAYAEALKVKEYSKRYLEWIDLPEEEKENTITPLQYTVDLQNDTYTGISLLKSKMALTLPSKYELADEINLVVKNQEGTNTCWAFSATTVLETYLQLNKGVDYNFSERHLDYATSKTFLNGEINKEGFERELGMGGNFVIWAAYFTRGSGPILEEDMPFQNNERKTELSEIQGKNTVKKLDDFIVFASVYKTRNGNSIVYYNGETQNKIEYTNAQIRTYRESIKQHIRSYGGVSAAILSPRTDYYDSTKQSLYYPERVAVENHAVVIVGWDDGYSKENFNEANRPIGDGAWIVLNSYGDTTLKNGYYYISYEDYYIETMLCGVRAISDINYSNIYQYDPLGCNLIGNYKYGANVFTRENPEHQEYLTQVSITSNEPFPYEIYVNAQDGILSSSSLKKVAYSLNPGEVGYTTVKFDEPILLTGNKFAVAVNYKESGVPIEIPVENGIYGTAISNKEESYVGDTLDSLYDLWDYEGGENINVCVKAFTIEKREEEIQKIQINQNNLKLLVGAREKLEVVINPSTILGKEIIWETSNPNIATVSDRGIVKGIGIRNNHNYRKSRRKNSYM